MTYEIQGFKIDTNGHEMTNNGVDSLLATNTQQSSPYTITTPDGSVFETEGRHDIQMQLPDGRVKVKLVMWDGEFEEKYGADFQDEKIVLAVR